MEKAMAPHSSTLAWKIPWTEEPGGLQSMGSLRVRHDWATSLSLFTHALEKEMATHSSVLAWRIPGTGEPGGSPSMGSHRVGHDWSDLAAARLLHLYSTIHKTSRLKMKSFSTVKDTQRGSQSYMEKRRGRWVLEVTWMRWCGISRGETR